MEELPQVETPHSLTIKLAPAHLKWLEDMAEQGESDVSTVLFWILHAASRMNEPPWPLGFGGLSPFAKE